MSIRGLFTNHAVIYRDTPTLSHLRSKEQNWQPLPAPAGRNARPHQGWSGNLTDPGPGEQQAAKREWFLHKGFDVRERDVIRVLTGPGAPGLVRVESVTPQPRRTPAIHHTQVMVSAWDGSLEKAEVGS